MVEGCTQNLHHDGSSCWWQGCVQTLCCHPVSMITWMCADIVLSPSDYDDKDVCRHSIVTQWLWWRVCADVVLSPCDDDDMDVCRHSIVTQWLWWRGCVQTLCCHLVTMMTWMCADSRWMICANPSTSWWLTTRSCSTPLTATKLIR